MGSKQYDLIGQKFNRLTVISSEGSKLYGKTKKRLWKCLCDCGGIIITNTGALTRSNTKSCGCLHNELSSGNSKKSRYKLANPDSGYISIMSRYKQNAKNRDLDFNLSFEQFKLLITSSCYYCNTEPSNIYYKSYYNIKYNGVDRKDNKKGYEIDNVVSCCKICNIAKNNNTYEDFLEWIAKLVKKEITELVKSIPNNEELGANIRRMIS